MYNACIMHSINCRRVFSVGWFYMKIHHAYISNHEVLQRLCKGPLCQFHFAGWGHNPTVLILRAPPLWDIIYIKASVLSRRSGQPCVCLMTLLLFSLSRSWPSLLACLLGLNPILFCLNCNPLKAELATVREPDPRGVFLGRLLFPSTRYSGYKCCLLAG